MPILPEVDGARVRIAATSVDCNIGTEDGDNKDVAIA